MAHVAHQQSHGPAHVGRTDLIRPRYVPEGFPSRPTPVARSGIHYNLLRLARPPEVENPGSEGVRRSTPRFPPRGALGPLAGRTLDWALDQAKNLHHYTLPGTIWQGAGVVKQACTPPPSTVTSGRRRGHSHSSARGPVSRARCLATACAASPSLIGASGARHVPPRTISRNRASGCRAPSASAVLQGRPSRA